VNWRNLLLHGLVFSGIITVSTFGTSDAWAQEDDDDWFESDDSEDSERSNEEEEEIDLDADPDDEKIGESKGDGLDLGEEYDDVSIRGEGEDDADIYRKFKSELERLGPAEEAIEWRGYLDEYPKSIFRPAIEDRIDKLEAELYDERIEDRYRNEGGDGTSEIKLTQPLSLENIDPRTKFRAGFQMGLPSYFNLLLDYEHQLQRELSVHGGLKQSYLGWAFEPGVKYAFVKSARLQMLATANFDMVLGTNLAARPTLGWGKRFELPQNMTLDLMTQIGSEMVFSPTFDPRLQGGLQIVVAPTETVRFFLETQAYMKDFAWDDGDAFAF